MKLTSLHIISFDVPYPPDYGGVMDVFYKMKALSEAGTRIILHCYEYGRKSAPELSFLADEVYYYPRKTAKSLLFNTLPYIVLTRNSPELRSRLLKDDFPILMEGLHSTYLLNDPAFEKRKIIVRTHNVEHEYYNSLAKIEKNIFKRYYFYNEAGKLQKYESVLKKAFAVAAISPSDTAYFMRQYKNVHYITAFHPFEKTEIKSGSSDFAFYHGNLGIGENNEAALYLVQKIFNDLPFRLIIAGRKPSEELVRAVNATENVEIKSDLSFMDIQKMVAEAQCNVLPTFQATGIKLKLIASLYCGRTCIVNTPMVINTGLESLCVIADSEDEMKIRISEAMKSKGIDPGERIKRDEVLLKDFSNRAGAKRILNMLD
jgi:hypothetical protein